MSDNEASKGHKYIRRFTILHRDITGGANTAKTFFVNNDMLTGAPDSSTAIRPAPGYFWKIVDGHVTVEVSGAAATTTIAVEKGSLVLGGYTISKLLVRVWSAKATGTYWFGVPSAFVVDECGITGKDPILEAGDVIKVSNGTAGALSVITWNLSLVIEEYMEEWMVRKTHERR